MVVVRTFRGLRYVPERLAEAGLQAVLAPPYDVIEPDFQDTLYERHPANVVRLILNRKLPTDTAQDNVYTRAAQHLAVWWQEGLLALDAQPAIYAYSQLWTEQEDPERRGTQVERYGLVALLRLEPYGNQTVLPHEATLGGPKLDRLNLIQATGCNLSQVFMLYNDPSRTMETLLFETDEAQETAPWQVVTDDLGVLHRFRAVSETGMINQITALLNRQTLLIADGHHRYETALEVKNLARQQWQAQNPDKPLPPDGALLTDYAMVFFSNMADPGLVVYPTHRLLTAWPPGWSRTRFESELLKRFQIVTEGETFAYQFAANSPPLKLKLREGPWLDDMPDVLRPLDVAQLDAVVFRGMFGMDAEKLKQDGLIRFERQSAAIDNRLQANKAVAAFLMGPPQLAQVRAVCEAGYVMPQKSTYFSPKILSGLVMYPYRPDRHGQLALDALPAMAGAACRPV
jgi:uncharacterized protein (DUF1015 family)